jgi:hypothetical protein
MFLTSIGFAASPAAGLGAVDGGGSAPLFLAQADPPAGDPPAANPPVVDPLPDVDVDIHRTERVVWYTNPLVIGGIVLAVVALIVALARGGGGGTTVVKG